MVHTHTQKFLTELYYTNVTKKTVFVHGLNLLWLPVVSKVLTTTIAGTPCFKFVKPSSSFDAEKKIVLPEGLKLTHLESRDVDLVKKNTFLFLKLFFFLLNIVSIGTFHQ